MSEKAGSRRPSFTMKSSTRLLTGKLNSRSSRMASLDVYIEQVRVAIEYQGAQHDLPIAYFGGVEGFQKTQERDARKLRLCKKHGVALIYVRGATIFQWCFLKSKTQQAG